MAATPRKRQAPRKATAKTLPAGTRDVTAEEMGAAISGPSVYVNKTVISGVGTGARLTFLEVHPNHGPQFRAAVMMDLDQLLKLKALIEKIEESVETIEIPAKIKNGD